LLRFHLHPSQCRSIGQTIGLTAYPPQRAAIFTMPLLTRTFPAYFRLGALFEASDISTTSEPTVPSGIVSFGPADPVCANHLSCKGSLTPRLKSGACARPIMVTKAETLLHSFGEGIGSRPVCTFVDPPSSDCQRLDDIEAHIRKFLGEAMQIPLLVKSSAGHEQEGLWNFKTTQLVKESVQRWTAEGPLREA